MANDRLRGPLTAKLANARLRKVNAHDGSCFCGLKTVIKKSGTAENPNRLFHACPRYRKGSHCNYFKWVDDDEFEAVGVCGTKKDAGADMEVEGENDEWRVKVAWKLGTLEAEVRALKLLMILMFVVVMILCYFLCTSK
ncbi:hypothetical protein Ahy_A03g012396 [Arachis hypogaea]|uniref:GRF-type domain-containing protein n=1 Tax=Arachis hypogaea TaxID=3818 RepID=A0A445DTB8_ARAHY|nr:hypothetical protein Ahy_A03g012396 [Arachis hypogaea]